MTPPYAFGDSELARERLALVAATFEAPSRALLADLPPSFVRYVLDLGCGPGHTTALLADAFPLAQITGYDASPTMLEEARTRVPRATFVVADVTKPLLLPADVLFARLALGHLPEPERAMDTWAVALRPGSGTLVCEEPVRYRVDDEWFARYEEAVTAVVGATGAELWAGRRLDHEPANCTRTLDRVVEHPVSAARAAGMFWRNAMQWRDRVPGGDALIEHFRACESSGDEAIVTWEIRQAAYVRRRG
ncbi:MAG: class I SAM-dependent methyltransferase [Actinomycetota bacterium]